MVEIFDELGYKKQTCKTCGQEFYSQVTRDTCGDAPCDEYEFIANPATDKPYNLYEIQKVFREFLESEGHTHVHRYPVLAKGGGMMYSWSAHQSSVSSHGLHQAL